MSNYEERMVLPPKEKAPKSTMEKWDKVIPGLARTLINYIDQGYSVGQIENSLRTLIARSAELAVSEKTEEILKDRIALAAENEKLQAPVTEEEVMRALANHCLLPTAEARHDMQRTLTSFIKSRIALEATKEQKK